MAGKGKLVIFVHGWSVRSTDTYGRLPDRLFEAAAADPGLGLDVRHIWLGRYVSFRDEVRMVDLSRAFEAAVRRELGAELDAGRRFACITHSTGGPVVRDWWNRHYVQEQRECPMSHLVMLAPANFGSALAQLGKSTASRLKTWFEGVEPGTGVLDWLELGSPEAWDLNRSWIESGAAAADGDRPQPFLFVLTGQTIDRSLYDHVNAYTGEAGSDGVVRVAAANLDATYVRLVQEPARVVPPTSKSKKETYVADKLQIDAKVQSPRTALAVLPGLAHSGKDKGILRSVRAKGAHVTLERVIECLRVRTAADYEELCDRFDALTARTQADERIERIDRLLLPDTIVPNERRTMIVVRISDDHGYPVENLDFLLTSGPDESPDMLPQGFFSDRQRNRRHRGTLTLFLNHDVMTGQELVSDDGRVMREVPPDAWERSLGFRVSARPEDGLVHYLPASFSAHVDVIDDLIRPNATLLLDIVMRRFVRSGVFTQTKDRRARDFTKDPPGAPIQ